MMDTLKETLVRDAFREGNLIPVGTQPTVQEMHEGLNILESLIRSLMGNEVGENLIDFPIPRPPDATLLFGAENETEPVQNTRLMVSLTSATTIMLPTSPSDGARLGFVNVNIPTSIAITLDGRGHFIDAGDRVNCDETLVIVSA